MNNGRKKILLVDDDINTREMYAEVFKISGFEVVEADDGVDGLDKATKTVPDVIFTGIIMPRMDGFEMIETLKKNIATCNIPIIISSHLGRESDRQRANLLGVRDFIIRDVTPPREVVERIKAVFMSGDYKIDINPYNMDAPNMIGILGINKNFQCLECGEKVILKMKIMEPGERRFEAIFVCPSCGWEIR